MKTTPPTALEACSVKSEMETEVAIYCKVSHPEGLKQCVRFEHHQQLEGKFENGVKCRVRMVEQGDSGSEARYYFTYKLKDPDSQVDASREHTVEVDESFYNGFKKIASRLLVKTRYVFTSQSVTMLLLGAQEKEEVTIPSVEYEVDVYTQEDGTVCAWCKIDIEIDPIVEYLSKEHPQLDGLRLNIKVSHLPFKPTDMILPVADDKAQQTQLDQIWAQFAQPVK